MPFTPNKLSRVALRRNPAYVHDGRKSYVYALQKYNIGPTVEGPFAMVNQVEQTGAQAIMQKMQKKVGGKAYLKGQKLAKRDAAGKFGNVPAEDVQHDSMYLAEVEIGSPPQKMDVDFDTGSSDLWVWCDKMPGTVITQGEAIGHVIFKTGASSTFKPIDGATWQIEYGDGSGASGTVGNDVLVVGGVTVKNQAIETATKISAQFQKNASDGLMGLAYGSINTVEPVKVKTPVENMISQGDTDGVFTAHLGSWRHKPDTDAGDSFYTFGYIDQDVVKASNESIHYVDINNSMGFWNFQSPTATVNGKVIDRPLNTAILDTGTTLAMLGDNVCEEIYRAIPGAYQDKQQSGWVFPTSTPLSKLPVVQLPLGSKLFTIHPEDLQFAKVNSEWWFGGCQSRGDLPFDIYGDMFLKNIYAIFDQRNKRLGCVQRYERGEKRPSAGSSSGESGSEPGSPS